MRSITSFCSMKCWSCTTATCSSRWNRIGDEMLYGRLPTTRSLGAFKSAANWVKFTRSTSDSITFRCGCSRRRTAKSRSNSMTLRRPRRSTKGCVSAAKPGPISTMGSPGCGSIASTMLSMMAPSVKKCWPKRLRAMCFKVGSAYCGASRYST